MSGPKKADVEAALNIARNSQRQCASLIAKAEDAALARLLQDAEAHLRRATDANTVLDKALATLTGDMQRIAPDSVAAARTQAEHARRGLEETQAAVKQTRMATAQAREREQTAERTFRQAEQEYQRAAAALRNADSHYLHDEMSWANRARDLYDQAAQELAAAATARRTAQQTAAEAARRARETQAALTDAQRQTDSTRAEAETRLRAEAEARRIAEQQRRAALLALEQARAALTRLDSLPHQKFRPGSSQRLQQDFTSAVRQTDAGYHDQAAKAATQIQQQAQRLEQEVAEAQRQFERQRAAAAAELDGLGAALAGVDAAAIRDWANTPAAYDQARQAHEQAQRQIEQEQFDAAGRLAQETRQTVMDAMRSAAENRSAHEQRDTIGKAVMNALTELGFDVSFEAGTRTDPMRISGQTPDPSGKGDFDIAIPLNGAVDFHVEAHEGDTTCVAAVEALRQRLASRGIRWNTTDWGHAQGAGAAVKQRSTERTRERIRSKS